MIEHALKIIITSDSASQCALAKSADEEKP
jgi:hypothetical protein